MTDLTTYFSNKFAYVDMDEYIDISHTIVDGMEAATPTIPLYDQRHEALDKFFQANKGCEDIGIIRWKNPYGDSLEEKGLSWIMAEEDYYKKKIDHREKETGLLRVEQLIIANILTNVKDMQGNCIYLAAGNLGCRCIPGLGSTIMHIAKGVAKAIKTVTKRHPLIIDLFSDALIGENYDERGIAIITSDEEYTKLFNAIPGIIETILDKSSLSVTAAKVIYNSIMKQYNHAPIIPHGGIGEVATADDIDLELEIGHAIDCTPYSPEKFANRLLTDCGCVLDTTKIIRGTRLAKPHKIIKALPLLGGSLHGDLKIIDSVVEYCVKNANIPRPKDMDPRKKYYTKNKRPVTKSGYRRPTEKEVMTEIFKAVSPKTMTDSILSKDGDKK